MKRLRRTHPRFISFQTFLTLASPRLYLDIFFQIYDTEIPALSYCNSVVTSTMKLFAWFSTEEHKIPLSKTVLKIIDQSDPGKIPFPSYSCPRVCISLSSGLYYKPMTIVNDDSRVINKLEASLTDHARVIIYDRHMFIVQATYSILVTFFGYRYYWKMIFQ
jgi:hypothetical protein